MIQLPIKHRIQLDNALHPYGSCNCTSVAMVVEFLTQFKHVPEAIDNQPHVQFEDKLLSYCDSKGLSRHDHGDLKQLLEMCGVSDDYRTDAMLAQVLAHLDKGLPCISAGFYTASGHIVVLSGYTNKGLIVKDPYGEWCREGYLRNYGDSDLGDGYELSYRTWEELNLDAAGAWIHFCKPA